MESAILNVVSIIPEILNKLDNVRIGSFLTTFSKNENSVIANFCRENRRCLGRNIETL